MEGGGGDKREEREEESITFLLLSLRMCESVCVCVRGRACVRVCV